MTIWLDFACNDPDNGDFEGKFTALHLPDEALLLETSVLYGSVSLDHKDGKLRVGRTISDLFGYTTWTGNWCWDAARVSVSDAAKILNYLKKLGWQCVGGWCELCEKWEAGTITADDLREIAEER